MSALANNDPNIYFLIISQGEAKWGVLNSPELFVLPSHQENFGIVIAEAMACKVPVLILSKVNI